MWLRMRRYHELMKKLEAVEKEKRELQNKVAQLEQEKEMLWLQANPGEFS